MQDNNVPWHMGACVTCTFLLLFFSTSIPVLANEASVSHPKLLLISMDGFGWNFFNKVPKADLPHFVSFMKKGVHARWVENVFPTLTRPNHMSLISGLYTESHGIVANHFYDPELKEVMPEAGKIQDSKWVDMGAEPVWITNSLAGEDRLSGSIYWPCADAKIKNRFPDQILTGEWNVTEEMLPPNQRIDKAFDWFTLETNPLNFVAVYLNEPDEISHEHGPDSSNVQEAIRSRDKIVEHILLKMKETKLEDTLNVIITADHGQAPAYRNRVINLDLLIDPELYNTYLPPHYANYSAPMMMLWPKPGCADCYEKLVKGLKHVNLHVATSNDSEDLLELHFSTNKRIAPIVIWGETGWVIITNKTTIYHDGQHGWDPRYSPLMYPFFIAMGPAFKKGVRNAEPFQIVDIYPLMCHILGIAPAPNNGSLSNTAHILASASPTSISSSTSYTGVAIGVIVLVLAVVIIFAFALRHIHNSKNVTNSYRRSFAKAGTAEDLMTDGTVVLSGSEDDLACSNINQSIPEKHQESDSVTSFRRRLNPQLNSKQ